MTDSQTWSLPPDSPVASWVSRLFVSRWDGSTYAVIANQLRDGRQIEIGMVKADVLTGPELERIGLKLIENELLQGNNYA